MPGHAPGFSFALHPTRCRAFVLSCYNTAPYKRLKRVLCRQCSLYRPHHKTARRALQGCFLQLHPFHRPRYQTDTRGYNTTCATLERITTPQRLQHIPQIPTPRRTLYRPAQPPYYNKVYKAQRCAPVMDPCQTVQHIADQASPAEQSSSKSAAERRGTIGGLRRSSFRASAR